MSKHLKKIGIIQSRTLPGAFPDNLRQIVQGYRECLDHGADIVIAPLTALFGPATGDLKRRRSFLRQMEEAAATLAAELAVTDTPLLTGYCINPLLTLPDDDDDSAWEMDDGLLYDAEEEDYNMHASVITVPCLIHRGTIRILTDGGTATIGNILCHVTTSGEESLPDGDVDLIVHMPETPWHNLSIETERNIFSWESHASQAPVVCVHPVGSEAGQLFAGGSALFHRNKMVGLLPLFEQACCTLRIPTSSKATGIKPPELITQVEKALLFGIRDTVQQQGYGGVCLSLDYPNSKLLAYLCVQALGADNVCGISFSGEEYPGIQCINMQTNDLLNHAGKLLTADASGALEQRLKASLMTTYAEEKGLMLLSTLDRHTLLLGEFTLYGESCGYLAPLGNLYRIDSFLLCRHIADRVPEMLHAIPEPPQPEQDRIIHDLSERNISATDLLHNNREGLQENSVRSIQRKIAASALKRTQLPIILRLAAPSQRLIIPLSNRLND